MTFRAYAILRTWMRMAGTPRRKVLVVDDDPSWRSMMVLELEDLGYEAVEAADGSEALRLLEAETAR